MTVMAPPSRIAADAVGLAELTERAELLTRIDRKYLLTAEAAESVLDALAELAPRVLEIDGIRDFAYESVYFDTPELLSYRLAAHGRRRRFKLRTRGYLDTDGAYLELKTQGSRSATVKERVEVDPDRRSELTGEGLAHVRDGLAGLGLPSQTVDRLRPTEITSYRRTTLLLPGSAARATVDTDLEWVDLGAGTTAAGGGRMSRPDLVVIETKSPGGAGEVDRILRSLGHRPTRISKFATGLAAMRPDLPANRWARVLRRHFSDHRSPE